MKIKKLTIHGFKSFVDRTTFNFPMGTSAIIGPNGCGKSNIVDAIRWVLGEQNARHLRGKQMEDVIFTGSDSRKPVGMAEVVLTFANDNGSAPARYADYTEIEIARRLYRSGESDYYINKVPTRLKDVVELFTDTGIGTRAYSIIEQGQIGWLVSTKPEERRTIFEEAAGINKYKNKKEAALRRLEATRENLTRVSDITNEVKRQLNSLNRQARKAERYKVFKDELRAIDLTLSSVEYASMTANHSGGSERLDSIKDEEARFAARIGECEATSEGLKLEYLHAEGEFKAVRERVFNLERSIKDEEGKSALAAMRAEELGRAEERLASEIEELGTDARASTIELERLAEEGSALDQSIDGNAVKLEECSVRLDRTSAQLGEKQDSLAAENALSMKCTSRLAEIKYSMETAQDGLEENRAKETAARREAEEIETALRTKEQPLEEIRESASLSANRTGAVEAELAALRETVAGLELELQAGAEALKTLRDEFSNAGARKATLEEMSSSYEDLKSGAKTIMQNQGAHGIHGLIADVIETRPGYEKAVEAVLGERLQYVIVESHREGVEAIDFLKANLGGRSSFVSVKDTRPGPSPVMAQAGTAYYPEARELLGEITVKDGYQEIISCLVKDTLVVDNLDAALDIWRRNGIYRTLVTLDGEVIDPQGVLTGGTRNADTDGDGILARRREIKELEARTSELASRINTAEAAATETQEATERARAQIEQCRERLHAAEIEKVNLENELKLQAGEEARLVSALEAARAEAESSAQRQSEISTLRAELSKERETLEGGIAEREAAISTLGSEISEAVEAKERDAGTVTELKVILAQATERRDSLLQRRDTLARGIEEAGVRVEAKKNEIEQGRIEVGEKRAEIEASKNRVEELLALMDEVKKEEVAGKESLVAMDERIKACEAELKGLHAKSVQKAEQRGALSIEIKELELEMSNLKDRIAERYGCDIASFKPEEPVDPDAPAVPDNEDLDARRTELRERIAALGPVSLSALEEYNELDGRYQFLVDQQDDLNKSVEALMAAVARINRTTREKFRKTFNDINEKFKETFPRFFNGGKAELRLTDESDVLEAGVEIIVQPPGKRLQNLSLLSGGEKALTATALIFAIFLIKPSPFCLLDEVDAPLDDANIDRFNLFVRDLAAKSQILLITHNKKTMEMSDALYGITMEEPGVSKTISVKF